MPRKPIKRQRRASDERYGYTYAYTKIVGIDQNSPEGEFLEELANQYGAHDSEWREGGFWMYFYNTDTARDFLSEFQAYLEEEGLPPFDDWTIGD